MRKPIACETCEKLCKNEYGEMVSCPFDYDPPYMCYTILQPKCSYCGEDYEDMISYRLCGCDV